MKGILGQKLGMTQVFTTAGLIVPVTVVKVRKNVVTQVKTADVDGYNSLQLATIDKKEKRTSKALKNHFKNAKTTPKRFVKEIRNMSGYNTGDIIPITIFESGEVVDVSGVSKGKGFTGNIKRHNHHRAPMAHGSGVHRAVGSVGSTDAARVFKNHKMPGQHGGLNRTSQNLTIVSVDSENDVILIKGCFPGANNSFVIIKSAIKQNKKTTKKAAFELNKYAKAQKKDKVEKKVSTPPNEKDVKPETKKANQKANDSKSESSKPKASKEKGE